MIGFAASDIESFRRSTNALYKAQTRINNLIASLHTVMEFDRKSLWNLMKRALVIACSDESSDIPYSGGVDGEINFLLFCLGRCSEREPSGWFELLVASLLSSTSQHDTRVLNAFISRTAYKTVPSLAVVAMLTSMRISDSPCTDKLGQTSVTFETGQKYEPFERTNETMSGGISFGVYNWKRPHL